jgi:hypothetical protein
MNFISTFIDPILLHLGGALSYQEIVALRQAFKYQCYFFCKDSARYRNNRNLCTLSITHIQVGNQTTRS